MLVAAVGMLATACGGGGDEGAGPTATVGGSGTVVDGSGATSTSAPEPDSTTTTTFAGDPYAVPEVIDVAYVNRVLAGLDQAVGDIVREVVAAKSLLQPVMERLVAVYQGEHLQLTLDLLQEDQRTAFAGYQEPPGNRRTTVHELLSATSRCIFAEARRDYSAVATKPPGSPSQLWIRLEPLPPGRGPAGVNATNWILTYDGFQPGRLPPEKPCEDS